MKRQSKIAALGLLLLGLPLGTVAYCGRPLDPMREFGLLEPELPQPNAYPEMVALGEQLETHSPSGIVDERFFDSDDPTETAPAVPAAHRQRWVESRARYFAQLRSTLTRPMRFPMPSTPVDESGYYGGSWSKIGNSLIAESHDHTVGGRHEKAVASLLDSWELALKAQQGTPVSQAHFSEAMEIAAHAEISPAIASLNTAEAARAASRLEAILKQRPSLLDFWSNEKHFRLMALQLTEERLASSTRNRSVTGSPMESGAPLPAILRLNPVSNWKWRRKSAALAHGMDTLIATAGQTWGQHKPGVALATAKRELRHYVAFAESFRFSHTRAQVQGNLLLGRLALHAYRKAHGSYPSTLDQLVPRYLKSVPQDTFGNNQPLQYRKRGARYVLWSVGPDTEDDGGMPIVRWGSGDKASYSVWPESLGDILAGTNDALRLPYRIVPAAKQTAKPPSASSSS